MQYVTLEVKLTLRGPILSQSTGPGSWGVDAAMARRNGVPVLPFSLVRGKLSEAWEELNKLGGSQIDIEDLLGPRHQPGGERRGLAPHRGRLAFRDFVAENSSTGAPRDIVSIKRDNVRQATDPRALRVIEAPFGAGAEVTFAGEIDYFAPEGDDPETVRRQVETGLRWVGSFGAERTTGYGRNLGVTVATKARRIAPESAKDSAGAQRLEMRLTFREPFCLASGRPDPNIYVSSDRITGAVVRGTLASTLNRILGQPQGHEIVDLPAPWSELGRNFREIRFSHLFPVSAGGARPRELPLSIVVAGGLPHNVIGEAPRLLEGLPQFRIDWKAGTAAKMSSEWGWAEVRRELLIRTKISPAERRAEKGQLFGLELAQPEGIEWVGWVDLSEVDEAERGAVEAQLRGLLGVGLCGVGKSKARADVELGPAPDKTTGELDGDGPWVLTLQTPALLCDPAVASENREGAAGRAYADAFAELSDGALQLEHEKPGRFFASQTLVGGYLARRYPLGRSYAPFLVTDAGSVFLLAAASGHVDRARACLARWSVRGLDLPAWAGGSAANWKTSPFLPEDGFGEVVIEDLRSVGGKS